MENILNQKIGILGGGQLGKMLVQSGSRLGLDMYLLEESKNFPATKMYPNVRLGNFKDYDDVYSFGKMMDVITVEIETVNTDALRALEKEGKKVYPQPEIIDLIKDKGTQKAFYVEHGFPTSAFRCYSSKQEILEAIEQGDCKVPLVQKARKDGYDGKGVSVVGDSKDFDKLMDVPSIVEEKVNIHTELSVIIARSSKGEIITYPAVEMRFHPEANLVDMLVCPCTVSKESQVKANRIAQALANKLQIVGLLAVEFFVTKDGRVLINEVAPRPHNSGHHTIEANACSQYEQHLRAILALPLGSTKLRAPVAMVNLLGSPNNEGATVYENLEKCLQIPDVHVHLYGKEKTRPMRKMGHVTAIANTLDEAVEKATFVRDTLIIRS